MNIDLQVQKGVHLQIWHQVYLQVESQVRSQVYIQVYDPVYRVRDPVLSQIEHQMKIVR